MSWFALIAACQPDDSPSPTEPSPLTVPEPTVAWSSAVDNVPFVGFAPWSGPWWVAYGLDGAFDQQTPATLDDTVAVLGLKSGRAYEARVEWLDGEDTVSSDVFPLDAPTAPPGLPSLEVLERTDDADMAHGYVLTAVTEPVTQGYGETFTVIYDGDGDPVWWQQAALGHIVMTPSLGIAPGTVLWDDYDWSVPELSASAVRMGLDGTDRQQVPLPWGHHAVIEVEPGVLVWGARDVRPSPTEAGAFVTADRVFEAPLAETLEPREVSTPYDDVFQGVFQSACVHSSIVMTLGDITPLTEWSHLNSVVYLPERDALLLHLRWIDGLVLVDRGSGQVLWQMSGPYGEFDGSDGLPIWDGAEAALLSHAHLSQAWDGGLVAFDNGNHHDPARSSIVELAWDEEHRTVEEVFRWFHPDAVLAAILGDVRKLPSGGYLASWSTFGELTEVAPDGVIRWRAKTSDDKVTMRVVWMESLYVSASDP